VQFPISWTPFFSSLSALEHTDNLLFQFYTAPQTCFLQTIFVAVLINWSCNTCDARPVTFIPSLSILL